MYIRILRIKYYLYHKIFLKNLDIFVKLEATVFFLSLSSYFFFNAFFVIYE